MSSQDLYRGAYKTIVIIFQITLKELDNGYQEFYLVDDLGRKNYLAKTITTFEHGIGYENEYYKRYEFYAEVSGKSFTTPSFTLGFSANGGDWCFGNVKIQLCLSNEERKISKLINLTNVKVDDLWPKKTN